ncbi:MAG: SdrD B-like domain-containing protein, partial [Pirellula sp.]
MIAFLGQKFLRKFRFRLNKNPRLMKNRRLKVLYSLRNLERLEDRKLMAVVSDGNFQQMFNILGPNNVTQVVERNVPVSHGADAALAISANFTDSQMPLVQISVDGKATFQTIPLPGAPGAIGPTANPGGLPVGNYEGFYTFTDIGPSFGNTSISGNTRLNSFVLLVPLGTASMNRDVYVRLTGGGSTDFIATSGSYHGVDQSNPVDAGAGFSASIPGPATSGSALVMPGPIAAGNSTLDAIFTIQRQNPSPVIITDLVTDPSATDPTHLELAFPHASHMTAGAAIVFGSASTGTGVVDTTLEWDIVPSGAGLTHAAVEVNQSNPITSVYYDAGDAPNSYGTTIIAGGPIHAAKGPRLGPTRDTELNGVPAAPGALADGDDLAVGNPEEVMPPSAVGDDEDGITFAFAPMGMPTFVSQSMAQNSLPVSVNVTNLFLNQTGYLTVYVDWNINGVFDPLTETAVAGLPVLGVVSGSQSIPVAINVPVSASVTPGTAYMRVRLHSKMMGDPQVLPPGGHANDGEVEDYQVKLVHGSEIHGFKFEDLNANGIRELGEPAMPGVAMVVPGGLDIFGNPTPTVLTGTDGKFWFNNLSAGTYVVSELLSKSDVTGDGIFDNGGTSIGPYLIDQGLRRSTNDVTVSLLQGKINDTPVFGNYITGSIHGVKFEDLNGNGVWDKANEPAMSGISFDLYKFLSKTVVNLVSGKTSTNYKWELQQPTATSDVHGEFWFTNLIPGTYEVVEQRGPYAHTTQQAAAPTTTTSPFVSNTSFVITSRREFVWEAGASSRPMDLDGDGKLSPDEFAVAAANAAMKNEVLATPANPEIAPNLVVGANDKSQDLWFGNFRYSNITGFKYEDVNNNKKLDGSEVGLANVSMLLKGTTIFNNPVTATVLTGANGAFTFANVIAGNYTVSESTTTDTNNDGTADISQDMVLDTTLQTFDLVSGATKNISYQWANYVYGSIHGVKFQDTNANGVWDRTLTG